MATFWVDDTTAYTKVGFPTGALLDQTIELGEPFTTDDPHTIELLDGSPLLEQRDGRADVNEQVNAHALWYEDEDTRYAVGLSLLAALTRTETHGHTDLPNGASTLLRLSGVNPTGQAQRVRASAPWRSEAAPIYEVSGDVRQPSSEASYVARFATKVEPGETIYFNCWMRADVERAFKSSVVVYEYVPDSEPYWIKRVTPNVVQMVTGAAEYDHTWTSIELSYTNNTDHYSYFKNVQLESNSTIAPDAFVEVDMCAVQVSVKAPSAHLAPENPGTHRAASSGDVHSIRGRSFSPSRNSGAHPDGPVWHAPDAASTVRTTDAPVNDAGVGHSFRFTRGFGVLSVSPTGEVASPSWRDVIPRDMLINSCVNTPLGGHYSASVWVRANVEGLVASIRPQLLHPNVGNSVEFSPQATALPVGVWTRLERTVKSDLHDPVTDYLPGTRMNARWMTFVVSVAHEAYEDVDVNMTMASHMSEKSSTYFDGSMSGFEWTGDPYDSASIRSGLV